MPETPVIETRGLIKLYDGLDGLAGLDLSVPNGSICGFLGRNGAGKTTTVKALMGMLKPTGGEARVFGLDASDPKASLEIRSRTGFVDEEKDLYPHMTVADIVAFTASFYPGWRRETAEDFLRRFRLPPGRRVKELSKGMRGKLALLLALSRGAELLILDEPTAGLDPEAAEEVLQAIVAHVGEGGVTVFFSSHQLVEVQQVCDRVVIIDRGRRIVEGGLDELQESFRRIRLVFDGEAPRPEFKSQGVVRASWDGRMLDILDRGGGEALMAEARALGPASVDVTPLTLKEIFLEAVKGED
jgi:ABC-2 type transport system ATP-binding protein